MRSSRFTDSQILSILKLHEQGYVRTGLMSGAWHEFCLVLQMAGQIPVVWMPRWSNG